MREIHLYAKDATHRLLPTSTNLLGGEDAMAQFSQHCGLRSLSGKVESLLFSKKNVNQLPVGDASFGCDDAPPPPTKFSMNVADNVAKEALPLLKWARSISYIMEMHRRARISGYH